MDKHASRGARRQARTPKWSPQAGMLGGALLATLCAAFPSACCLVRPPDARTLLEAGNGGWRTPEAAFETFRVAFGSNLTELEYRSLSSAFRRRESLSLQTYLVARQKLLESNPLLTLLAKAKVEESMEVGLGKHRLLVRAAGRLFQVELVREDGFQIYNGRVFLADGPLDFDSAVQVADSGKNQRVSISLLVDSEDLSGDLRGLSSVRVERLWKVDAIGEPAPSP